MSKAKPVRFAALIRVSTEKQERTGESLRTQRTEVEAAVAQLAGRIDGRWYGGQEHATPGWEKKEIERLLEDARQGKFDAVIVTNADRWSRDNGKSRDGLEVFKQNRVRFFVGTAEQDLFNPEHRLFLGMAAEFGQFQAAHQNRKSILNRVHRAKRGWPACGKLPPGRTFDRVIGTWGIDPAEQAVIEEVARRYLAGESLKDLATEFGRNHSHLHKVLTQRCGDEWVQAFHSDDLNIHETVRTPIPRLLPEETILAVRARAEANKTYAHGCLRHKYLFSRMVFCARCGYSMFGQYVAANKRTYYRHSYEDRLRPCNAQVRAWVDGAELERVVMRHLFEMFGNPVAVQRAVEEATPDPDKVAEAQQAQERVARDLEQVREARGRLVRMVAKGTFKEEDVEAEMVNLGEREIRLQDEAARLSAVLANVPDPAAVKDRAAQFTEGWFEIYKARQYEYMTWEEKRALAELVFGGRTPDGRRMGVYVERDPEDPEGWKYTVLGHLVESIGYTNVPDDLIDTFAYPHNDLDAKLLEVTKSAWRTATAARWPRRSPASTAATRSRRTRPAAGRPGG